MKELLQTAQIIALAVCCFLFILRYIFGKLFKYDYITPFKRRCKKCDQEQWFTDDDYWIAMYNINNKYCKCHNDINNYQGDPSKNQTQ